jgi:hypothetical protein
MTAVLLQRMLPGLTSAFQDGTQKVASRLTDLCYESGEVGLDKMNAYSELVPRPIPFLIWQLLISPYETKLSLPDPGLFGLNKSLHRGLERTIIRALPVSPNISKVNRMPRRVLPVRSLFIESGWLRTRLAIGYPKRWFVSGYATTS